MSSETAINWEEILNKFYSYKGTITNFCRENNIKPHQLYYRRKEKNNKRELKESRESKVQTKPIFHAIDFKVNDSNAAVNKDVTPFKYCSPSNIKVEIGKARIYIPVDNKETLSNIFKAIVETC